MRTKSRSTRPHPAKKSLHAGAPHEISAFDAKTRLSELLRQTEQGRSFVICRHGKPVAQLLPPPLQNTGRRLRELIEDMARLRSKIEQRSGRINVKELIEEGRV